MMHKKHVRRRGKCSDVMAINVATFPANVALPSLGPLAPRRAVGARHDGLIHQVSTLLPVVCHGLCLCEGFVFA